MCSNSNKGVLLFPQCEGNSMKTPALESQTIPQKMCQTTRKCHSGIGLEQQMWGGKVNCGTKIYETFKCRAKDLHTKNAHDIKHSTNPPSVVFT